MSSAVAPVVLIGGWTVAARLQPGSFDSVAATISALAARDASHRWVMTAALAGVGACHVVTALALRPAAVGGRWVLAAGGVGTLLVAAIPLPGRGADSDAHAAAAALSFGALAAWPAFAVRRAARATGDADAVGGASLTRVAWPFRRAAGLTAAAALLGVLAWFVAELVTDGDLVGLSERMAAGSQAVWPFVAVVSAVLGAGAASEPGWQAVHPSDARGAP